MATAPAFAATPNPVSSLLGGGGWGGATVGSISGAGPWTATLTGMTTTAGLKVGQKISATAGTGSLGSAASVITIASIVSLTSVTITVTGGTTPTAGTVTAIISGFTATNYTPSPYDTPSGAVPIEVCRGGASGSLVTEISAKVALTSTSTAAKVMLFRSYDSGVTWTFWKEIVLAAATASASVASTENNVVPVNCRLKDATNRIGATVTVQQLIAVHAEVVDF